MLFPPIFCATPVKELVPQVRWLRHPQWARSSAGAWSSSAHTLALYSFLPLLASFTSTVKWCMVLATTWCLTFTDLSNSSITFCTYIIHVMHHQWWLQRSQLECVKVVVYAEGHVLRSCHCAPRLWSTRAWWPRGLSRTLPVCSWTLSTIPTGRSSRPWLLELSSCAVGERGSCSETIDRWQRPLLLLVVEQEQIMFHEARSA